MKHNSIKDPCATLLNEIKIANAELLPLSNNGISRNVTDSGLQELSLSIPEELYQLYEFSNGFNEELIAEKGVGEFSIFPDGVFNSFEKGVEIYQSVASGNPF